MAPNPDARRADLAQKCRELAHHIIQHRLEKDTRARLQLADDVDGVDDALRDQLVAEANTLAEDASPKDRLKVADYDLKRGDVAKGRALVEMTVRRATEPLDLTTRARAATLKMLAGDEDGAEAILKKDLTAVAGFNDVTPGMNLEVAEGLARFGDVAHTRAWLPNVQRIETANVDGKTYRYDRHWSTLFMLLDALAAQGRTEEYDALQPEVARMSDEDREVKLEFAEQLHRLKRDDDARAMFEAYTREDEPTRIATRWPIWVEAEKAKRFAGAEAEALMHRASCDDGCMRAVVHLAMLDAPAARSLLAKRQPFPDTAEADKARIATGDFDRDLDLIEANEGKPSWLAFDYARRLGDALRWNRDLEMTPAQETRLESILARER